MRINDQQRANLLALHSLHEVKENGRASKVYTARGLFVARYMWVEPAEFYVKDLPDKLADLDLQYALSPLGRR